MQVFDILIVGGGPAGSTLAYKLRNRGLRIGILDKAGFPRQKVCAGWVTPAVMRALNIDLDDYSKNFVLQPIQGFRISLLKSKQIESRFTNEPVSYGIRRFEFDHYLLQRCHAELLLGEACKQIVRRDDGCWEVNQKYRANLIVGAGGHYCPVARFIDDRGESERCVVAQETEFEMTPEQKLNCPVKEEVPELFFTPDLLGYGWIFRKGDYLNIGLGREDKIKLSGHVHAFCDYLVSIGKIPAAIDTQFSGHAYILYNHAVRRMINDGILLIGDAAGLAYPQSGEGIRPAVESAMLAAEVIRQCDGSYSIGKLQAYMQKIEARFGERNPPPSMLERLPVKLKKTVAGQLMKTQWFTKNIVTEKWFLQSQQAELSGPGD